MVDVQFNGERIHMATLEDLMAAMARFDREPRLELWLSVPEGPRMMMLRNQSHAWLMYLRFESDSGFVSVGDAARAGHMSYQLSNGQVDEYPLSWCIPLEPCHQALFYFFVNEGLQPAWIQWQKA